MYCPECGAKNEDSSRFCYRCGTPLLDTVGGNAQGENMSWSEDSSGHQDGDYRQYGSQMKDPNVDRWQSDDRYREYQRQGYQRQRQPGRTRGSRGPGKAISGAVIASIVGGVLAIILVVGIYKTLEKKSSPETVAMKYWEATADCDWALAYEYCEFPDGDLLTKQMYVDAHVDDDEALSYKSATVIDIAAETGSALSSLGSLGSLLGDVADYTSESLEGSGVRSYAVEYMEKGSSDVQYSYVTLSKTEKKQYLFWDEWKVTSSDLWCSDLRFQIPESAAITLNGTEVSGTEEAGEDGWIYVTIPYLFAGKYQMEVSADGMKTWSKWITVSSGGCEDTYIELEPSDEVIDTLGMQVGSDIRQVVEGALNGKDFDALKALFTENAAADSFVREDYEALAEMKGDGSTSGILTLQLADIRAVVSDMSSNRIVFQVSMEMNETYLRSWTSTTEQYSDTITTEVIYEPDGDSWKLAGIPVTANHFTY